MAANEDKPVVYESVLRREIVSSTEWQTLVQILALNLPTNMIHGTTADLLNKLVANRIKYYSRLGYRISMDGGNK
jgi:hypothetical protein